MKTAAKVNRHYGRGGLVDNIQRALALAGKKLAVLTVDDLAPVDEFHSRGRAATVELAEFANLSERDRVIDIGCGLGGTARYLAQTFGCEVSGVDLTAEFVMAGEYLTGLVGLESLVSLARADALELPFDDECFTAAWTEHVQMNIKNKVQFYSEMARVLRPGGRLLFHDIFSGPGGELSYPVPWAEDESISFLISTENARKMMESAGLRIVQWVSKDQESINFFDRALKMLDSDGIPPLGVHLLMGKNVKEKLINYLRNLREGRITVALGLAVRM
ncbi:MAG: methyltransferase domain-containing protein [Bdellovibrionales bacterium]|nr:methyltransferase domain-containing protein [Bdellovibrionales bacterium]